MDEPRGHYAKRNKPVTKGQVIHDSTYMRLSKQPNPQKQSRMVVARGCGKRPCLLLKGYKASVL